MNRQDADILNSIYKNGFINQRILSERSGHSVGIVNKSLKNLIKEELIDENIQLTSKGRDGIFHKSPRNAVILAAGFGMRMVPINMETPKAFLEIGGEPLIERLIKQLQAVGVRDITVVVGFLKEKFEYLIDEYNVKLVINKDYALKNNIYSLQLVSNQLSNTYIIPCDVWCEENPFRENELYSWYMVSNKMSQESDVVVNRKKELVKKGSSKEGNSMIGIAYLDNQDGPLVKARLDEMIKEDSSHSWFWEEALYENNKMFIGSRIVDKQACVEINTYEQLRELDEGSNHLKSDAISIISKELNVSELEIRDIEILKKGMTNRSFLFTVHGKRYIMRIPGEGTDSLINRYEESQVYQVIQGKDICDNIIYINPSNGYKITEFIEESRVCDFKDEKDLVVCMKKLRDFHQLDLKVDHEFDLYRQINFYESLWNGKPSVYKDYLKTKERILSLRSYIEKNVHRKCLTHIDAVSDNFLFLPNDEIRLIDWEYAAMQDPYIDIAMFAIYALYTKVEIDRLIDIYFQNQCDRNTRIKIYCYIATCGLLWSNWCEFKGHLGVEFGEYSLRQYRYAKEFFKIVEEEMNESR